ncbi:MAG TPA: ComEC/Rec2 family competence protein, partial [Solirubrobacterales bacterium]|nr:ComEC/Rec2 family competence protein [Solirubrobacterales bacterium]
MKQWWRSRARDWGREWRLAALAGGTAGLALAPVAPARPSLAAAGALPLSVLALAATRPRGGSDRAFAAWLAPVALVAALTGFLAGGARIQAIDGGALRARDGVRARAVGFTAGVPRRAEGEVSVPVETPRGRVLVVAPEPIGELPVGRAVIAEGVLGPPEPWRAAQLRRQGVALSLRAKRIELVAGRRAGLEGGIDGIRDRAERALARGMGERESSLARGFVLGEDDLIDGRTREDFRRSGLAHLLAVSGQNVVLLCLLAWPLLALLGLTLRARLVAALCLIAIYVPVAGAGPSIQRAGVMGAAGLIAALADRPRSRWYAVLLAAGITLAVNPRATGDVGWQLSFAAVVGILLWSGRIAASLARDPDRASPRRAIAEGVALTTAATLGTAPLMAHHFEQLSLAALPANLLALPAVAPAMWLGMLAGIVGQLPAIPVEPLNWVNSLCLAYIAQIAHWLASPGWALLEVRLPTTWSVAATYAVGMAVIELAIRWLGRRRRLGLRRQGAPAPEPDSRRARRGRSPGGLAVAAAGLLVSTILLIWWPFAGPATDPGTGLVVRVLDVGQGDAILLQPPGEEPVLVDAGPPGSGVEDRLRELGISSLAAVVISHSQADHVGGLGEVLEAVEVDRVGYASEDPRLRGAALAAGAEPFRFVEGEVLGSGDLRLAALWPPRELRSRSGESPNELSLVLVASWRHFSILLTGDAEAEAVPIDPGPVDVLKVAHHGSEDAGLAEMLDRT